MDSLFFILNIWTPIGDEFHLCNSQRLASTFRTASLFILQNTKLIEIRTETELKIVAKIKSKNPDSADLQSVPTQCINFK